MKKLHNLTLCGFVLLLLWVLLSAVGCATIEAAKDRKAVGRVLSSDALTAAVGKRLPPCANDTVISMVRDTVYWLETDTAYEVYADTVYATVTNTQTIERTYTNTNVVLDKAAIAAQVDSTNKYKGIAIKVSEQYNATLAKADAATSKGRTLLVWLILALVLLIVSNGAWIYFKIIKPY